jgi:hypothetical protein
MYHLTDSSRLVTEMPLFGKLVVVVLASSAAAYKPRDAKACCIAKCEGTRAGASDCASGCHYWMAHSSLNWEGAGWHGKLEAECLKDCGGWKSKRVGHTAWDAPNHERRCAQDYCGALAGDFVEHQHPWGGNISDEFECRSGCTFFAQCKAAQPPGPKPPNDTLQTLMAAEAVGAAALNVKK